MDQGVLPAKEDYAKQREASIKKTEEFIVVGEVKFHVIKLKKETWNFGPPLYLYGKDPQILYTVMSNNSPVYFRHGRRKNRGRFATKAVAMRWAKWLLNNMNTRAKCYAWKDCQFCGKRNGMAIAAAILRDSKNPV
jgi:hypothetical protein